MNFPAGVTGNEPQICGTGHEGKCEVCLDKDMPLRAMNDGEYEIDGVWMCEECIAQMGSLCCGAPIERGLCVECLEHV
jgi:hypothetical protein